MSIKGNRFVTKIVATVKNSGPLHIGNGEGDVLIDQSANIPLIPATSIAGTFRSYIQQNDVVEKANLLFGSHELGNSRVYIYDAFSQQKNIELRPSLKIDSKLGSALKGHKLEREFIGAGHLFHFRFELYGQDQEQIETLTHLLYTCLKALNDKYINLGGLKTSGAGYFDVIEILQQDYDLNDYSSFSQYLKNENERLNVTDQVMKVSLEEHIAEFELQGKLETPLLIKGNNSNDHRAPDAENIKNTNGQFIIPGSSIKGILRSHSRRVLNYLEKENLLEMAFGSEAENKEDRIPGRVFTEDVVVGNSKDSNPYHRIKIDRFTGGVMNGALIIEQPIIGDTNIKVRYKCTQDEKIDNAIVGLLSLVLRDLSLGKVALGSGNNIGRGRLSCQMMKLKYKGEEVNIDLLNNQDNNLAFVQGLVDEFLSM